MVVLNRKDTRFSHRNITPRRKRKRKVSKKVKNDESIASPQMLVDQSTTIMMTGLLGGFGSAIQILIEEVCGEIYPISQWLHLQNFIFITAWTAMGLYFFVTGDMERQRECVNTVLLSTAIPGTFRMLLHTFQYWYHLMQDEYYDDGNYFVYLMIVSMIPIVLIGILSIG